MKLGGLAVCAIAASVLLAGCASTQPVTSPSSGTSQSAQTAKGSSTALITIRGFGFRESSSVPAGTTVTITNMDSQDHTVTADNGSFDVVINGKRTASFTAPTKPGSYTFHCTFHPYMHGTLVVT